MAVTINRFMLGSQLSLADQKVVLAKFVNRYTGNHTPRWVLSLDANGLPYKVQFADDQEWLQHTRFAVNMDGSLDGRIRHCESSPTWPNNPELRNENKEEE